MDFLIAALGLGVLVLSGDALVRGAVNASLRLGVPALIVSLTIVAIGTSMPELLVAVDSVVTGVPGIALGNVIGSNTANVLLVLGVPALVAGINSRDCNTRASYLQMLAGTAVFVALAWLGPFGWLQGVFLTILFAAFIGHTIYVARAHQLAAPRSAISEFAVEGANPRMHWAAIGGYIAVGLVGLPFGADLLVNAASSVAERFGLSHAVIGLTMVAVGTSLPELATTVAAALRRHAEVALGNVIGSNLANLLGIVGISALFGPIPVEPQILTVDLWVMVAASLGLAPFVFLRMNITRVWGIGFVVLYVVYIINVLV